MNTNKKLKVKDIFTVVLLALINVVIFFASSLLYATPVTIMLMPVLFSLLEGIVFFIIGTRVRKPGAMMLYAVVRGILGGYLPYVLLYFLSGIVSELILRKSGYGSVKGLTISYILCQLCAALGSTIYPYVIAAKSMADMAVTDGRQGNIDAASRMLLSGGWIALLAGVVITAFFGAMIGKRVVKKHLEAVGMEG